MITRESILHDNSISTLDRCPSSSNSLRNNNNGQTNPWDLSCNAKEHYHQQEQEQLPPPTSQTGGADNLDPDGQLLVDKKARKKDQNRRAAYNYRRKKIEEKNRMREEEMRLVYSRVCLIGYAEELEGSIMYILNTKTMKIFDKCGNPICFLCPICLKSCDNLLNLRSHLNLNHYPDPYLKSTICNSK